MFPPGMVDGDPESPILVVGMAPGKEELEQGRPFVGPSGKLLWSCAADVGFSRADCYIVNTIGEMQDDGSSPSDLQFDQYWDLFDAALRASRARVVICLGADAFWRTTGITGGILDWRGYVLSPRDCRELVRVQLSTVPYKTSGKGHKKGDPRVLKVKHKVAHQLPSTVQYIHPTVHPSYVIRSGYRSTAVLAYDIARAKRALDGQLALSTITYTEVPGTTGGSGEPISIDIETSRSLVGKEWINRIGVSTPSAGTWTAPWTQEAKKAVRDPLEDPTRLKIGHNLAYDLPRLRAEGIQIAGPLYDTMFACQTLQPDLPKGLNFVASLYLDAERWKHKSEAEPALYNALDVHRTLELYHVTEAGLRETGQLGIFTTMMEALPVLMEMTEVGLRLDPTCRDAWLGELAAEENVHLTDWNQIYPGTSIGSNAQLKKLYYDTLQYRVQRDDKGKPTTDETAIKQLSSLYPDDTSLQILLKWRKVNKLRTTYAEVKLFSDGCVHPSYTATAKDKDEKGKGMAGTGRIQPRNPNIAQVPVAGRRMYIPHDLNNILVEFDYVQAELRVVAALSGDASLLARINGPDIHQAHADLWGCSRKEAKNVTYATLYGSGKVNLQRMFAKYGIKKKQSECEHLLNQFYRTYPTVKNWKDGVISTIWAERRLRNPFGRIRYFWNPNKDTPAALDYLPQSTVADIMWSTLLPVSQIAKQWGGRLLTTVYDSYLFELPKMGYIQPITAIERFLTRLYPQVADGFYLPVSWHKGDNWGDMSTIEVDEELQEAV